MARSRSVAIVSCCAWLAQLAGCSLVVDPDRTQCSTDGDCTRYESGDSCSAEGYCVDSSNAGNMENTGGTNANSGGDDTPVEVCEELFDCPANEICSEEQCVAPGEAALSTNERWACLDSLTSVTDPQDVTITLPLQSSEGSALAGATATLCRALDPKCQLEGNPVFTSDENGEIELTLAEDFAGFLQITAENHYDHLYYLPRPRILAGRQPRVFMITLATGTAQAEFLEITLDETRGAVLAEAFDCSGTEADGVVMRLTGVDGATELNYVVSGVPVRGQVETQPDYGSAMIFNVRADSHVVEMTNRATHKTLGNLAATVRPLTVTQVPLIAGLSSTEAGQ